MSDARATERRHAGTVDLDVVPTEHAVRMLLAEDRVAVTAAEAAARELGAAIELAAERVRRGGRIHVFGAGASGRIAFLDRTELRPTFGVSGDLMTVHFPGGDRALLDSGLDLEDDDGSGQADASAVAPADVVLGVTASGSTPYVRGALQHARALGAATVLVTSNPASPLEVHADVAVVLDTGPEALTGSTRLKAGTATKVALNAFSTVLMVRLGRTYSNLMVGMAVTNAKLRERAVRVLVDATGEAAERCGAVLEESGHDLPAALTAMLADVDPSVAAAAVHEHGSVRAAVHALRSR